MTPVPFTAAPSGNGMALNCTPATSHWAVQAAGVPLPGVTAIGAWPCSWQAGRAVSR